MKKRGRHLVVAIARQYGSGGSYIGKKLATRLGCRYLDREILVDAAARLRRDPSALEAFDERNLTFWERTLLTFFGGVPSVPWISPPVIEDDRDLFDSEIGIMREAAERGPVVIVGRASAWVLRDAPGLLSLFIHAPLDQRVHRVRKVHHLASEEEARKLVLRVDKRRQRFFRCLTGADWPSMDLCTLGMDTGILGTSTATELAYTAAMTVSHGLKSEEPWGKA
jgi:CMP/dCMP kinase